MSPPSSNLTFTHRILLATVSGVLTTLVFPKSGLAFLAWICLVPLLVAVYREPPGRALCLAMATGLVFFSGTCHWIMKVLQNYGDLSWIGAVLLFALLAFYLSLFFGLFGWAFSRLSRSRQLICFGMAPSIWVGTEYLRAHVLTGFPWCLLGYALVDATDLAQLATVTGVYGLSFVIMATNASVAAVLVCREKSRFYGLGTLLLGLAALSLFLGVMRQELPAPQQLAKIVQTNIGLDQRWDMESKSALLNELSSLSQPQSQPGEEDHHQSTPLVLWPETPAPFYFNQDADFRRRMQDIAISTNAYFLFGFVDFRRSVAGSIHRDPYNSVALLSPQAQLVSQYDKIHLVPFGEYVPYASLFFFVDKISTEAGNFKSGSQIVVSPAPEGHRLGAFVCYEAVVPDLIRQFAKGGAEVFVNVTNDAWFGESAAPFQHLAMARMRAIENRRYLLRAANNGVTAVVDPFGRVVTAIERNQRAVMEARFNFETVVTVYAGYGDVFAWLCLAVSGAGLVGFGWRLAKVKVRTPRVY